MLNTFQTRILVNCLIISSVPQQGNVSNKICDYKNNIDNIFYLHKNKCSKDFIEQISILSW